jgi:hypothetical protein
MRQVSPIDVCLLIDDMHQLAGPASQALLAHLVRHLPSNGHLVLSGRAETGVPLARLRVTGECVEITEQDLAFTPARNAVWPGCSTCSRPGAKWPAASPGAAGPDIAADFNAAVSLGGDRRRPPSGRGRALLTWR